MTLMPAERRKAVLLAAAALVALVVAGDASRRAAANAFAEDRPALALRLAPGLSDALAARISQRVAAEGPAAMLDARAVTDARKGLQVQPLNAALLRTLGLAAEAKGGAEGKALIELSARVSRRDVLTQLWLIEDAVRRNDIAEALKHYDIALSTSAGSAPVLFPVLAEAISNPEILRQLIPYVRERRAWVKFFVDQAADSQAPEHVAALMRGAGVAAAPEFVPTSRKLLTRFAESGAVSASLQYARDMSATPPADLGDIRFSAATTDSNFAPLTWQLSGGPDVEAELDSNKALQITVASGSSGVAVTRALLLAPGSYAFSQSIDNPPLENRAQATWQALCLGATSASPFWSQIVPERAGRARYQWTIAVPPGCSSVRLSLLVSGGESSRNATLSVSDLTLSPRSGRSPVQK